MYEWVQCTVLTAYFRGYRRRKMQTHYVLGDLLLGAVLFMTFIGTRRNAQESTVALLHPI
jgi:hypothetical protein